MGVDPRIFKAIGLTIGWASIASFIGGLVLLVLGVIYADYREELGDAAMWGFIAGGVLFTVLTIATKPKQCLKGHTDIGLYYGQWSCRTCYRLRKQARRREARRHFGR